MSSFNWLHLSDLHFGLKNQDTLWPNIREAFWKDLETIHERSGPWHAVLFTGDIVQGGAQVEYSEVEDKVFGPLWNRLAELGSKNAVLLAVPGNHDLLRPEVKKPKAALRLMLEGNFDAIADEFWEDPNCEYREIIANAFANYEKWWKANSRLTGAALTSGNLPGDFIATINVPDDNGTAYKVGIAGINTTFLQLTNGNYAGRLALDPRQLHQACSGDLASWTKDHDACILMTHQGPDWLNEGAATAYSEINPAGRFAVHLFGHMHENVIRSASQNGGKSMRQWQGSSLFGLEKFGEPPEVVRRHGYSAGRIQFGENGTIRHFPRRALKDPANGWRFCPDNESCILIESDSGTTPEILEGICNAAPTPNAVGGTPGSYLRNLQELELELQHALEAFKGQPVVFLEPRISKRREFNEDPNELHSLMATPRDALVVAPSEFGLTCLGLHLQVEAFRKNRCWIYIDAEKTKGRKIVDYIDLKLLRFEKKKSDIECIVLDGWRADDNDHLAMVNNVVASCVNVPLVILAEDSLLSDPAGNLSKLSRKFEILHLQALSKSAMRRLVDSYNTSKKIGAVDSLLTGVAEHLESINVHRTPLNCYTVLRVLDSNFSEKIVNKSKLLKAILFVLFTDHGSFSYVNNKPEVEECAYVLGCFCKDLVREGTRCFDSSRLFDKLRQVCVEKCMVIDIDAMIRVLVDNNVIVTNGTQMMFRHRFWIYYFAAEWMRHDDEFNSYILGNRNYINYPEIIEFYAGVDGKRTDALEVLLSDLTDLIEKVDSKIGIARPFDPLTSLLWSPSDEFIEKARTQIAERVESSNLPAEIKDKHADKNYRSEAPYDQSIRRFLDDYSVLMLLNGIKAACRALRNSPFVDVELKHKTTAAIFQGWEELSRVIFWISPMLATDGKAIHDGFALRLSEGFSTALDERFKEIITSNPYNVVGLLGGDLASKKIGPLIAECFEKSESMLQKHMILLFTVAVRPEGWEEATLAYINRLHPRSFYLGDLCGKLTDVVTHGDLDSTEEVRLKQLIQVIFNKREYAGKEARDKEIPVSKVLSDENMLPIDQLLKGNRPNGPIIDLSKVGRR